MVLVSNTVIISFILTWKKKNIFTHVFFLFRNSSNSGLANSSSCLFSVERFSSSWAMRSVLTFSTTPFSRIFSSSFFISSLWNTYNHSENAIVKNSIWWLTFRLTVSRITCPERESKESDTCSRISSESGVLSVILICN